MNFKDGTLNQALGDWASDPDVREKASAHNLLFDERLFGARGDFFEAMAKHSPMSADRLRRSAIDYYRDHVRVSRGIPHSFMDLNAAAGIKPPAPELKLIRIEDLREPLEKTAITPSQLIDALSKNNMPSQALVEWFVDQWNTRSDIRRNPCSFSAIKNQCLLEIGDLNWPELLRDKYGLDHFDATRNGDIPVALMEFEAGDILDQVNATPSLEYPFCIPTALDCEPNPQFFPTPTSPGRSPGPLDFGCPMGLFVILSSDDLIAEVLHPRLTYKRENIAKVGVISAGLPDVGLKEMRDAHLWALRIEADRADYGAEL